jgi:hypothetical protein
VKTRYFRGFSIDPDEEIDAAETGTASDWLKATFDDDGTLLSREQFDQQQAVQVDYYAQAKLEDVQKRYPGVRVTLWKTLSVIGHYVWKFAASYDGSGKPLTTTRLLIDDQEQEWMEIERNPTNGNTLITKYYWEDADTLRFSFEYNEDGTFSNGYDIIENDHVMLEDVLDDLDDPDFYRTAERLPKALAGTTIPPEPRDT